jgi:hypothetical protein
MIVTLSGVMVDGTVPLSGTDPSVPMVQNISWPEAEDGVIKVIVVNSAGAPVDISTGDEILLTVRRRISDAAPLVEIEGDLDAEDAEDGVATFTLEPTDTQDAPLATYVYDVQFVDQEGLRWQVVPASAFRITAIVGRPPAAVVP